MDHLFNSVMRDLKPTQFFHFDYPINIGRNLYGTLHCSGYRDRNGMAIIDRVLYTSENQRLAFELSNTTYRKADVTELIMFFSENLFSDLCDAAANHIS